MFRLWSVCTREDDDNDEVIVCADLLLFSIQCPVTGAPQCMWLVSAGYTKQYVTGNLYKTMRVIG